MQNHKLCTRCQASKPLLDFALRAKSADGHTAACRACINLDKWTKYQVDPTERQAATSRATAVRQARFADDPAYKRAFNMWGSTKKRDTKIPPWVAITDFVPVCKKAIKAGTGYELDHVIPLNGDLVCGLHVPTNLRVVKKAVNQAKGNRFDPL